MVGAAIRLSGWLHWQDHEQTFTPLPDVAIAPGRYFYNRWAALVSAAPSARFTASLDATTGEFYDGRMHELSVSGTAVASPHVALDLTYTLNVGSSGRCPISTSSTTTAPSAT